MIVSLQKRGCLLALLALTLFPWSAPRGQGKTVDFSALDQIVNAELKDRQTPGAAVAVIIGDRVVYAKGYGVANIETGAPVTPEMLFRMGSTTKMFTAAALVTLADKGKIKLNAPIGDYVKGLDPSLARLTAHQLLSQSSGLRDFASPIISQDDSALGANVRSWKDDVFFTEPGKIYSYSSAGYWLAGFVTEELHGKPYAEAMEDLLFKPLGMTRTTLRPLAAVTYPLAIGHNVEDGKPTVIRPIFNNVAMWPGGSIISSVNELSRFVIALMNGGQLEGKRVLSPLVVEKVPAQQVALPGSEAAFYGYGLMNYEFRGVQIVTHGGASRGYGSTIEMVPAAKFAVIVLTNKSGETLAKTRRKAMELALALKGRDEASAPKAAPLTESEMADYVGSYVHAPQTWEVFVKDSKLFLKYENTEFQLTKVGERTFSFAQGSLVFVAGANGKTEHLFTDLYAARKAAKENKK